MTLSRIICYFRGHVAAKRFRRANVWYVNCSRCGKVMQTSPAKVRVSKAKVK